MRFTRVLIWVFLLCSCQNKKISTEPKSCQIDPSFLSNYLNDINQVIIFSTEDEKNSELAYKAFINLEILVNSTYNLDSLSILFHDSNIVQNKLQDYLNNWLIWLNANRCNSLNWANQKFDKVKEFYPPADYNNKEFIEELKIKNYTLIKTLKLSDAKIDSILIEKHQRIYIDMLPGWVE